jgi:AcrR family transcriptional regulator
MSFSAELPEEVSQARTRRLLLEAASEVFVEVGFRSATIRQICQRAGANIAAVNYHFGDKETLYLEVLQHAYRLAIEKYPPDMGISVDASAEQRLKAFVQSYLLRLFSEGPQARFGKLITRELVEPTAALDEMVKQNVRSLADTLMSIVRDLLGPGASEERLRLCGISVVSQVVFYHHCRPVISRMFPEFNYNAEQIELLAEHITHFSLAAIRQISRENPDRSATEPRAITSA